MLYLLLIQPGLKMAITKDSLRCVDQALELKRPRPARFLYDLPFPADNIEIEQGAAFLIPELDLHISMNLSLWPSSTRAELAAIIAWYLRSNYRWKVKG